VIVFAFVLIVPGNAILLIGIFPIVPFHFKMQPIGLEEGAAIAKYILIGPIKLYDS
jgi:hypothetical protein